MITVDLLRGFVPKDSLLVMRTNSSIRRHIGLWDDDEGYTLWIHDGSHVLGGKGGCERYLHNIRPTRKSTATVTETSPEGPTEGKFKTLSFAAKPSMRTVADSKKELCNPLGTASITHV